jgi:two-component system, OmpR family, response regulator RegX3
LVRASGVLTQELYVRVLLAEDDTDLLDVTTYALRKYGYDIIGVTDGATALERWRSEQPDLVLLDVNLPRMSGMDICEKIRRESSTPIIMITAMGEEDRVVEGFERGADDYLIKPISYRQLAMRMRAVAQRRDNGEPVLHHSAVVSAAGISVDLQNIEVRLGEARVRMTRLETRVLYFLVANAGRILPTDRLVDLVWSYEGGDGFALKTHICQIRRKLGIPKGEPGYISNAPHVGYTLETGWHAGQAGQRAS